MKKGFTLIELLAVIVILAIIALIATPIVLNIINDTKESATIRSAGFYLDAVEYSIADRIMDDKTIEDGTYNIIEKGNICLEYDSDSKCIDEMVVEVDGDVPTSGTITINSKLISEISIVFGGKTIVKNDKGELVFGKLKVKLLQYINDLYNPTTTSLEVDGITYNLDEVNGLMNDRLGISSVGENEGNIRYYGANPNNYIDIGDRDSSGNVILWRIIGLFKDIDVTDADGNIIRTEDLVKIIRADSIGYYSFDYKYDGTTTSYLNNWSDATLNTLLNEAYYNSETTSYYNGSTTATTVDLTSIGLSESARNKVESVLWNLGGHHDQVYPNNFYVNERGNKIYDTSKPVTWSGKVALLYPSDYGYAADSKQCNLSLDQKFSLTACKGTDWLFNQNTEWTLTPWYNDSTYMFTVRSDGATSVYTVNTKYGVRPVLYLKSDTSIVVGEGATGSKTNYYVVE